MIDHDLVDMGRAAGKLIAYGLDPKARPNQRPEYAELCSRVRSDGAFRALTEAMLSGLGLSLLHIGDLGVVLGCRENSPFAMRSADYRQNMSVEERLCHGLIQLAVAAWVFPKADTLMDSEHASISVSTQQLVTYLRQLCQEFEQLENRDPDAANPELREAWRAILERAETRDSGDGRRNPGTLSGMVNYALETLAQGGLLRKVSEGEGGTWLTLTAYRIQVRELAATESYELVRRLGRKHHLQPQGV